MKGSPYVQHNSSSELNKSDIALAQIYLDILGDNLFYQDKKIYIYLENEWWCDTEGHFVKKNFFQEMTKYYLKLKDEINKQINEIEGEEGKENDVEELLAQIEEIKDSYKIFDGGSGGGGRGLVAGRYIW